MRKTFLKVALIGLLVGSLPVGFTSCKDYDDDIENLQNEQNSLKTQLSTVESSISSLQSAASTAQAAADAAKAAAAAAQTAAEKAAAEGKAAAAQAEANAIKAAQDQLEALKAELQKQITDNTNGVANNANGIEANKKAIEENAAAIAKALGQIETLDVLANKLKNDIASINGSIGDINGSLNGLTEAQKELQAKYDEISKALQDAQDALTPQLTALDAKIAENAKKIGNLEAALATQTAALEAYKTSNDAAVSGVKGDITAIQGDITAIQAAIEELNKKGYDDTAIKNEIANIVTELGALSTKVDGISTSLNTLASGLRVINGMITHIEVVYNEQAGFDKDLDLFVVDVTEDRVFGKGLPGEVTFTKGQEMIFKDELLVRVSPANAVVTADQIQLVNTNGDDVSKFITITEVTPYDGLLIGNSRSINNNGLHVVKFELKKEYDRDTYKAATTVVKEEKECPILFAVAIADNEKSLADNREITSAYDVAIVSSAPKPVYNLLYNVDDESVTEIHNRFNNAADNSSFAYANNVVTKPAGQAWTPMSEAYKYGQDIADFVTDAGNLKGFTNVGDYYYNVSNSGTITTRWANGTTGKGANVDNRQEKKSYTVELDKKFTVALPEEPIYEGVYGFYVAIDTLRATESNGSERTAWLAYEKQISGLNKVVKGNSIDLQLNMKSVEPGEEIGFRVYAVNYNGTLVDPDGRAFYVQVGEAEAPAEGEVSFALTAKQATNITLASDNLVNGLSALSGDWMNKYTSVTAEFKMDADQIYEGEVELTLNGVLAENGTLTRNATKGYDEYFKKMNIKLTTSEFIDGETYTGKLTIKAPNGSTLQTIIIKFVKNIPTAAPTFNNLEKAGQVKDGKIDAYVAGTAAPYSFDLNNVFNFSAGMSETITWQGTTTAANVPANGVIIPVAEGYINRPRNPYSALNINYTYANVSYVWDENKTVTDPSTGAVTNGAYVQKNVVLPVKSYQISFNTLTNAYVFSWNEVPKVDADNKPVLDDDGNPIYVSQAPILVQNEEKDGNPATVDVATSTIYVTSEKQVAIHTTFDKVPNLKVVNKGDDKVSLSTSLSPYFKVVYNETDDKFVLTVIPETNPVGPVEGTLNIPYKGKDGITCWKTLPLTMNAPQN